ncbi:MAG: ABC transporter ATP-binding protein [Bdellovibrionales bacterium]|nr:ABC transporter ATP-binding protein [Bdellovibrionales bacterium]
MSEVVRVEGLHKSFKKGFIPRKQEVLRGVDFTVPSGMITGFLGANGAGKTTTMKSLLGLAFPDKGKITFFGGMPISPEVKRRIGFLPEHPYFYNYLTGNEFLKFYGELSTNLKRADLRARIEALLKKVDLWHARDKKLKDYSKGMLQKIGVAQALVHDPEFIILDEPMSGLDPDGRYYLAEIIRETAQSGKAVFFSSHHLLDAERLCANLVILRDGKVIYEGETEKLLLSMGHQAAITYLKGGEKQVQRAPSLDEAQVLIDRLRKEGATIFEVRQERVSLEEAFVKVALRGPEA